MKEKAKMEIRTLHLRAVLSEILWNAVHHLKLLNTAGFVAIPCLNFMENWINKILACMQFIHHRLTDRTNSVQKQYW